MNMKNNGIVAAKNVIKNCMGAKPKEQLLIITDDKKLGIAYNFAIAGRELGISTTLIEMRAQKSGEPLKIIGEALSNVDIGLLITSSSLTHTAARNRASEKGVRIASMPMMTEDIIESALNVDYKEIKIVSDKLADILSNGNKVRITTKKGTNLTLDISNRSGIADTGILINKGDFGNLPAGESLVAPIEGKGDGVLIVDGAISGVGILEESIKFEIEDGKIVKIEDKIGADRFTSMIVDMDENAWKIAEFGIGTNKSVELMGNAIVDEKVFGTIHIGFGNNLFMGGKQDSNIHYDCIIQEPTVYIDDKCIINDGVHII